MKRTYKTAAIMYLPGEDDSGYVPPPPPPPPQAYELTVVNGTGSGFYPTGEYVPVVADSPALHFYWVAWTGDIVGLENSLQQSTTYHILGHNATITATYQEYPISHLQINQGTGSGDYHQHEVIEVTAVNDDPHYTFYAFDGDTQYLAQPATTNPNLVTMPATDVTLGTLWLAAYVLTVTNGLGSGSYQSGAKVQVNADQPEAWHHFTNWTGDTANLEDVNADPTFWTSNSTDDTITAEYAENAKWQATINGGSGTGLYYEGQGVEIRADEPEEHYHWDGWENLQGIVLTPTNSVACDFSMPGYAVVLTSLYAINQQTLYVQNGTGGGLYDYGAVVDVEGDEPVTGQYFLGWTGNTEIITGGDDRVTQVTIPDYENPTITAVNEWYEVHIEIAGGLIDGGSNEGTFHYGQFFMLSVDPAYIPEGYHFTNWSVSEEDIVTIYTPDAPETQVDIIATEGASGTVAITCNYAEDLPDEYQLTVNYGEGSGQFIEGAQANISAEAPGVGETWKEWTGDVEYLDNPNSANTFVTMPAAPVTVTATYTRHTYQLTLHDIIVAGV